MSEIAIYLKRTKFTMLVGDKKVFNAAQQFADELESQGLTESIESATLEWNKLHIRVWKNREKVMQVACSKLTDAEITCIEI
ncbi:hypothetical protein NLZ15_14855 [Atlantibacter subterranea]|uniref:hypothetical protein n=1 Tax=Atlantibacter subterraneus TaxID=255519 RepID=UPI0020C4DD53|nr:hypothetical protein [Atlantibacter subterranea]UTJ46128.1 hypothetical protein NLZ15_14855 [Atlantibacter subterranea]